MTREKLSDQEIQSRLSGLNGWRAEGGSLRKSLSFLNFRDSLEFVNKVAAIAENLDHHPDITFGWGYADILFTTHDSGGITDKDFELAKEIDEIG